MPPTARHRAPWWIVPAVIVGIVGIAWLLLAGLPFGGNKSRDVAPARQTETIAEGTSQTQPGTVIEGPGEARPDDEFEITTTTAAVPPNATLPPAATTTTQVAQPPVQKPPATATVAPTPAPVPVRTPPPPATTTIARTPPPVSPAPRPPAAAEPRRISEPEAGAQLRGFVTSRNYYGVASECVRLNPRGFRNEGYAFEVWHSCAGAGSSRLLGRWRVDARTREVFVQRDNGKYLAP